MRSVCLLLPVAALPLNVSDQEGPFAATSLDFETSGRGLSGAPAVSVWQTFGTIGLGIQVSTIVGFQIWDVSLVPTAILKLGTFELGLGASLLARRPDCTTIPSRMALARSRIGSRRRLQLWPKSRGRVLKTITKGDAHDGRDPRNHSLRYPPSNR